MYFYGYMVLWVGIKAIFYQYYNLNPECLYLSFVEYLFLDCFFDLKKYVLFFYAFEITLFLIFHIIFSTYFKKLRQKFNAFIDFGYN